MVHSHVSDRRNEHRAHREERKGSLGVYQVDDGGAIFIYVRDEEDVPGVLARIRSLSQCFWLGWLYSCGRPSLRSMSRIRYRLEMCYRYVTRVQWQGSDDRRLARKHIRVRESVKKRVRDALPLIN